MPRSDGPRTTFLGKLVILAFVGACGWGAYRLLLMRGWQSPFPAARTVALRIGCGEGKHGWLTWEAAAFAKTHAARNTTLISMRDFATRGPDAYDAAFVYESGALELLDVAQKRWGELRVVYPERNLWSDNPYYILDAPWSTPEQREAAQAFLDFLLTETSQKQAIARGFRPADPHVPTNAGGSPFVVYQRNGVHENAGHACAPPLPATMANLIAAWQRAR